MLNNLRAEMVRNGLTVKDVAKILGVSERTIRGKLIGETAFTVVEAFKLRDTAFPKMKLEYLFAAKEAS